jgi:chromate transporter
MPLDRLVALFLVFAPMSLVSIGGGTSIFAEMQRQAVSVHGWMTDEQFVALFAISRAAPGPGSLISGLIGWEAAGFIGALVAALSLYVPSSILLLAVGHWWRRRGDSPARRRIERGLAPVAVGLIMAGVYTLMQAEGVGWVHWATLLACAAWLMRGASPYLVMAVVALLYAGFYAAGLVA